MKHSILILAMLFLISSCNNDEDGLITENSTISYFGDPGFGGFSCKYIIETKNSNKIFLPNNRYDLGKFFRDNIRIHKIKMTYRIIKEIKPGEDDEHCYIRNTKKLIVIIEIIRAEIIH